MADCTLAEDLAPPAGVSRAGLLSSWLLRTMRRGGRGRHDYGCVLLTGATGFVGRAVLAELLERGAEVRCLVRASSDAEAVARLQHALLLARRWRPEWRARLRVARGALGPEGLGMGADAWAALARSTAAIVHCGAAVDLKKGYAFHRRANVLGTREVLRLAAAARARLIFVSTTDVLPHAAAGVAAAEVAAAETACGAAEVKAADSGYAASKASPLPPFPLSLRRLPPPSTYPSRLPPLSLSRGGGRGAGEQGGGARRGGRLHRTPRHGVGVRAHRKVTPTPRPTSRRDLAEDPPDLA